MLPFVQSRPSAARLLNRTLDLSAVPAQVFPSYHIPAHRTRQYVTGHGNTANSTSNGMSRQEKCALT
jgi:hypothetical protein